MEFDLSQEPSVSIPVETLRAGDAVFVHTTIGFCVVSAVEQYGEAFVVAYFNHELENYGKRRNQRRIIERQLARKTRGDVVLGKRGAPEFAQLMHTEMREQQAHRWATIQSKSEAR